MSDCRCAWECKECRIVRLGYTGCMCSGCIPQSPPHNNGVQSPVEFARTLGILYRHPRECVGEARKVVLGKLVPAYPNPHNETTNAG